MGTRTVLFFGSRFWPGFQKLWFKGDFHSLLVSVLFSWFLVVAWLATFVWPEWLVAFFSHNWLAKFMLVVLWLCIFVSSIAAAIGFTFRVLGETELSSLARQSNLEQAQELYLQANYFEAERLVRKNAHGNVDDVESSLLWIAILRRTRRIPQALELISNIAMLDAALPWIQELQSEKVQCLRIKIQAPPAHA